MDTMKLLEGNICKTYFYNSIILLDQSPKAKLIKEKNKQICPNQSLKTFCKAKKNMNRMKRQPIEWEKIFANHVSDKELISKIHKRLTIQQQKILIKNMSRRTT